jgi:DNA-binding PadR family transcriptional regulator
LLQAARDDEELHGWALMKGSGRSGPTVYGVLDRLEDAGWVNGRSELSNPKPGRPPRRFYRLTPNGVVRAEQILTARRPEPSQTRRQQRLGLTYAVTRILSHDGI